jgi:hypothetical protein
MAWPTFVHGISRYGADLILDDVEPGSEAETDYARTMKADYMKAVDATLGAIHKVALTGANA